MNHLHHLVVAASCCALCFGCATKAPEPTAQTDEIGNTAEPAPRVDDEPSEAKAKTASLPQATPTLPEEPMKRAFDDGGIELLAIYQREETNCYLQYFPARRQFDTRNADQEQACQWPAGSFSWDTSPAAHAKIVDIAQNHSRRVQVTVADIRGDFEPSGDGPDVTLTPTALRKLATVFEGETHEPTLELPDDGEHFVVSRKEGKRIVSFRMQRNGHAKTIEVHPEQEDLGQRVLELEADQLTTFQQVIDSAWKTPATKSEDGWSFQLRDASNSIIREWTFADEDTPDWGVKATRMLIDAGWK